MDLKDILSKDAIWQVSSVSGKKRLLHDISNRAHSVYGIDAKRVFKALLKRESLGSTGIGRGVAIPHARLVDIKRIYGLFTRLENSVHYQSIDNQPIDLIFTLLAPKSNGVEHLKALALVSRIFRVEDMCNKLRINSKPDVIYSLLIEKINYKAVCIA